MALHKYEAYSASSCDTDSLRSSTTDDGASALTPIQNEIGDLKMSSRPSDGIKIEALLASLGPEYAFIVAEIDTTK